MDIYDQFQQMTAHNYEVSIDRLREALNAYIEDGRISKSGLARLVGMQRITLYNYLVARREPKLRPLLACAGKLGFGLRIEKGVLVGVDIPPRPQHNPAEAHWFVRGINSLMVTNHMTEHEMGKAAGMSYRRVRNIINGTEIADLVTAEDMMRVFGYALRAVKADEKQ